METYLQNRNSLTDIEDKLIVTLGKGWGGINLELGVNRYTLPCINLINNKDLLYSIGNYIQYLVITYYKNLKKNIYIYSSQVVQW